LLGLHAGTHSPLHARHTKAIAWPACIAGAALQHTKPPRALHALPALLWPHAGIHLPLHALPALLCACAGFMTAYASASYRRAFFDDEVFKQELAPDGCRHHDDIWFAGHLWLRQVRVPLPLPSSMHVMSRVVFVGYVAKSGYIIENGLATDKKSRIDRFV
jgi:hypothetical protein